MRKRHFPIKIAILSAMLVSLATLVISLSAIKITGLYLSYSNINKKYSQVEQDVLGGSRLTTAELTTKYGLRVEPYMIGDVAPAWGLDSHSGDVYKAIDTVLLSSDFFCVVTENGVVKSVVPTYE